ncbi:T6SS immunity protein Tdi1 domain-containing protein [Pseudoduganella violacea]|uniref:T6SS immunity protein Tdi1 C-terminal domain-containing protein n=1 Tax=Pseudoduganella violacea TaxID=1715466 RepID=A0A7W5BAC3_9BURK|nr:T6SS immunity protein Tdi1 domain-containing protein [Pseudoduganella violacea]MBB3119517.1 hypothetical protein [Pseudoduganella violacea]
MDIIKELNESWGWAGLQAQAVVGENDFGNLIIKDEQGSYWRLMPEECGCAVVAPDRQALDVLSADHEFLQDWHMSGLTAIAREHCGPLGEGRKYCLKIPGALGGEYKAENLASAPLHELIRLSGDLARQMQGLPDGTKVKLNMVD